MLKKSTIVFCVPSMLGATSSTLGIAKDLRRLGHRVLYCGFADGQAFFQQNGFDFIPVFSFPHSSIRLVAMLVKALSLRDVTSLPSRIRNYIRAVREVRRVINDLLQGRDKSFNHFIDAASPELFIVSSCVFENMLWALLAHSRGIPFLYLNDSIDRPVEPGVPPATSRIIPEGGWLNKAMIFFAWRKMFLGRAIVKMVSRLFGVRTVHLVRQFAGQYDYPLSKLDERYVIPRLTAPELMLWPREFDFSGKKPLDDRYYVGPCLDLARNQPSFPWNQVDDKKPMVYCALGSLSGAMESRRKRFLRSVVQAASLSQEIQWIVAIGSRLKESDFAPISENVILVQQAPQLEILRKASLMISHGGANTVRECLFFGVPMVLFPMFFDHPGCAARVEYHGIGLSGDIRRSSSRAILEMVSTVLEDPSYKRRAQQMQRHCYEIQEQAPAAGLIGSMIEKRFQGSGTIFKEKAD
jgi:zeaxanthin glucosyltransferase